jgi:hypothetical protein
VAYPCQNQSLVGVRGSSARLSALRCRCWNCGWCAPRLRRRLIALAMAGYREGTVRMLTLTSPAGDTVERSYAELRHRWKVFRERLRRDFPGIRFEYFAVTERQQRGAAHLHVLIAAATCPRHGCHVRLPPQVSVPSPMSGRSVERQRGMWPSTWPKRWPISLSSWDCQRFRSGIAGPPGREGGHRTG